MNLKKIIREEIGDFDWVTDTQPSRSDLKVFRKKHILNNYEITK